MIYLGCGKHDLVLGAYDPEASQSVIELLPKLEGDDPLPAPVARPGERRGAANNAREKRRNRRKQRMKRRKKKRNPTAHSVSFDISGLEFTIPIDIRRPVSKKKIDRRGTVR